jgi:hypothetical protein
MTQKKERVLWLRQISEGDRDEAMAVVTQGQDQGGVQTVATLEMDLISSESSRRGPAWLPPKGSNFS